MSFVNVFCELLHHDLSSLASFQALGVSHSLTFMLVIADSSLPKLRLRPLSLLLSRNRRSSLLSLNGLLLRVLRPFRRSRSDGVREGVRDRDTDRGETVRRGVRDLERVREAGGSSTERVRLRPREGLLD